MTYKLEKVKILIVEDMQPMMALTKSILNIFGFQNVATAKNGEEAFEEFKKQESDLVITDWLMEPLNGLELIEKIRKDPESPNPYVPVILMTGYSDKTRVEGARDSGVTEFLVKPYTARDLYSRIVQIVEKPRQFVDAGSFFGPDRRRRKSFDYEGPKRRELDQIEEETTEEKKIASKILRQLREDAKKV